MVIRSGSPPLVTGANDWTAGYFNIVHRVYAILPRNETFDIETMSDGFISDGFISDGYISDGFLSDVIFLRSLPE